MLNYGDIELLPDRLHVRVSDRPFKLGSRAYKVLEVLTDANGALVSKTEIMDQVWPNSIVQENNLHVHICAIRKALGSRASSLTVIPGRGYCLTPDLDACHDIHSVKRLSNTSTSGAFIPTCSARRFGQDTRTMATASSKQTENPARDLTTPTDLGDNARNEVSAGLTRLLADVLTLFVKTKNFHWHVSGPHFRDYHLLLDDQATLVFAMVDPIAERARKLGGTTLRSIGQIGTLKRLSDNDESFVGPEAMLDELRQDNESLVKYMRELHGLCDDKQDVATASLIENWIDQTEERIWFLFETTRYRR